VCLPLVVAAGARSFFRPSPQESEQLFGRPETKLLAGVDFFYAAFQISGPLSRFLTELQYESSSHDWFRIRHFGFGFVKVPFRFCGDSGIAAGRL